MLKLDFDPESKFEIPVDRVGELTLKKIKQTLEQKLKHRSQGARGNSRLRNGMPYGLVELKRGMNPDEVYEGNYLNMEEAALRMGRNGRLIREVPIYYTYSKPFYAKI